MYFPHSDTIELTSTFNPLYFTTILYSVTENVFFSSKPVVKKNVNFAVAAASKLKHGRFNELNMKLANAISSVLFTLFILLN